jgi:hypothetical protein
LVTPVDRLRSMQNQLWAVQEAAIQLRAPLAEFYELLSDEQRKQFIVNPPPPDARAAAQPNPRGAAPNPQQQMALARMCGMPLSPDWPVRRLEQVVQPNEAQRASLEALKKTATEMGQLLMASCVQPPPATPIERLDAAADRLTAVIFAASNVALAFNDFYGQLSDEQKSKLDTLTH